MSKHVAANNKSSWAQPALEVAAHVEPVRVMSIVLVMLSDKNYVLCLSRLMETVGMHAVGCVVSYRPSALAEHMHSIGFDPIDERCLFTRLTHRKN